MIRRLSAAALAAALFASCAFDPDLAPIAAPDSGARDTETQPDGPPDALDTGAANGSANSGSGDMGPRRDMPTRDVGPTADTGPPADMGADLPPDMPPNACPSGARPCGPDDACADTTIDPLNCGACGVICSQGEICRDGDCICRPEYERCGGECVDTNVNPAHCGECDNECNGTICNMARCEGRQFCPIGAWTCEQPGGKACVRGQTNDLYCDPGVTNTCGTTCAANEFCYDPGTFQQPRCVTYRPGIGCTACPCADCTADEACTEADVPDRVLCVAE